MLHRRPPRAVRSRRRRRARLAFVFAVLAAAIRAEVAHADQRTVITLHGVLNVDEVPVAVDEALRRTLRQGLPGTLDYYSEQLDLARFGDPDYLPALRSFLAHKYRGRRFDVVIATTDATLQFVRAHGAELFPGAPVAFTATAPTNGDHGPPAAGLTATIDMSRTIAMAARLQPELRRVFVVSGSSPFDRYYEDLARAQLRKFEGPLEITYWSGVPMEDLLERVANLPPNSLVYPMTITQDGTGQRYSALEGLERVTAAANAPVYTWLTTFMGHGTVGGSMFSVELVATRLAELALRILRGEKAEDIRVVEIDPNLQQVDWRQLQRWGLREELAPAGTAIQFREPSAWERHRSYIVGTAALVALQTALIVGLVVQRARRRGAEAALRTSHRENQDLAGRLITAQEEERMRIARELHDDVNQELAGLSIQLSGLKARLRSGTTSDAEDALAALQGRAAAVADTIRSLSHELHSGALEHAGLAAALREHCVEFARHHGIEVAVRGEDVGPLAPTVALCLYRVTQEALTNTGRHARARSAWVSLARVSEEVELEIRDDGVGFDPGRREGNGLGLRSISERVRLVGGRVSLESRPQQGTRLLVRIPLAGLPVEAAADAGAGGP